MHSYNMHKIAKETIKFKYNPKYKNKYQFVV